MVKLLLSSASVVPTPPWMLTETVPARSLADIPADGREFSLVMVRRMPDGTLAYTRDGALKTDSSGRIVTSDGLPVQGGFQPVPNGTTNITISSNGNVTYTFGKNFDDNAYLAIDGVKIISDNGWANNTGGYTVNVATPDGGATVLLLGLGLTACAAAQRKLQRR